MSSEIVKATAKPDGLDPLRAQVAIVKALAKGKLVYPGPLDRAHAWAYLPDLAQAFVAVTRK